MSEDQNAADDQPAAEAQATDQPRKILLGKRVLRHFAVRTGLQTGLPTDSGNETDSNVTSTPTRNLRCG